MTELDDDEALILAQARRALGPTSADEQRLLQRLLPQLARLPAPSARPLAGPSWALRAVAAVAVIGAVALSGGLGYRQGLQAGIAQQNQTSTRTDPVVADASTRPVEASLDVAPPAPPERSQPRVAKASSAASAPSASSAASAPRTRSEPPAPPAPLGLDEEVRQLRRVERAIRESNPRLALVLIEDLDRAIPAGQLLEERRAASLMANCQLGAAGAVATARAFATQHAGSAYLTRVIEICGLESKRNSAAPGTQVPGSGG
ncbi:MAG: hypothetical protein WDO74_14340 [Pseudomonadota bacterium]